MNNIGDNERNDIELNNIELQNYDINHKEINSINNLKGPLLLKDFEKYEENLQNKTKKINNTLYGNNITIKNPKKIGEMKVLFYFRDYPLIVIGPECKFII